MEGGRCVLMTEEGCVVCVRVSGVGACAGGTG